MKNKRDGWDYESEPEEKSSEDSEYSTDQDFQEDAKEVDRKKQLQKLKTDIQQLIIAQ